MKSAPPDPAAYVVDLLDWLFSQRDQIQSISVSVIIDGQYVVRMASRDIIPIPPDPEGE